MNNQRIPSGRLSLACLASILLLAGLTGQAQTTMTNGLVAYWNFDNKDFKDSYGKFDGTPNGANPIQFVAGMSGFGQAIQLDGVDQWVEITGGDPDDMAFQGASVSIATWFQVGTFDKSWQALVAKGEGGNWRIHRRSAENGMSYTGGPSGDTPTGTKDVNDGAWHHLVAITDAAAANFGTALYIDGELYSQLAAAQVLDANGQRMAIGDNPGARGRYWNGLIDDVAVWNRVLTEGEIKALYNNGAGKSLTSFFRPDVDSDNDGMPDWWELKYGLNPNDPSDAAKDLNGNGINNLTEYKLGLDPTVTTKPIPTSAVANANFNKVVVTFTKNLYTGSSIANDPRDATIATNLANYSISPSLAITAVTVTNNVVTLSTAKQTPGATAYTITVNNVRDVNNWPVAANTKVVFYSDILVSTSINSGLRAYWNFDNKDFKDASGNGFNGTPNGTSPITFGAGKTGFGQAITLDGFDQYVQITGGQPDDLAFAGKSVSIAGWFTVGSFDKSWQALIAKGEGSNWRVARNGTNPSMSYAGGLTDVLGAKDVTDGNWHHIVAISDSTGLNFGTAIYVDGVQDGTISGNAALVANGSRVSIGDNPGATGRYWNGQVDDFAIWDRVLSTNEIAALYSNGAGKPLSGLSAFTSDIPAPAEGVFVTQTPAPGAKNVLPTTDITFVHSDGKTPWTSANVTVKLDGVAVTPVFTKQGDRATIKFTPSALLSGAATHTVTVGFVDPGGQPATTEWSFTTMPYSGVTKDKVKSYAALVLGNAAFTADAKGITGKAGDYGIDLTTKGGPVQVVDASFYTALNAATAKDELSLSMWIKKYDIANSSAFWMSSPSQSRVFQAHTPWGDSVVYFDTAGCCDTTTQRISANIDTFSGYTGDISWWTNNWHQFVFTKKADVKNIYIDGVLFLPGSSSGTLSTDINLFNIGADNTTTGNLMHGIIDDVAIYGKELSQANVTALKGGTLPSALPATAGLLAYWDFNDAKAVPPVGAPNLKLDRSGTSVVLTFGGTLQSADAITGPWTDVAGASPMTVTPAGAMKFYRAKQ